MSESKNRESWLTETGLLLEPIFTRDFRIKPYRITCGWPATHAMAVRGRRVGECHGPKSSAGGMHEIFISPTIHQPLEVAGTICHEMTHVVAGLEAGHKGEFIRVARHIGLTRNKPTSAAPGSALEEKIRKLIEPLGDYPHYAMTPVMKTKKKQIKSITLTCIACACKIRISIEDLAQSGPPTCGCGQPFNIQEDEED